MRAEDEIRRRLDGLVEQRLGLIAYLDLKREQQDWHGVEDAGSDIRDLEAAMEALRWVLEGG